MAECRPLPIRAVTPYLKAKIQREIYTTDMLLYAARPHVARPESLPRYIDKALPKPKAPDYKVSDVIGMFRGG